MRRRKGGALTDATAGGGVHRHVTVRVQPLQLPPTEHVSFRSVRGSRAAAAAALSHCIMQLCVCVCVFVRRAILFCFKKNFY